MQYLRDLSPLIGMSFINLCRLRDLERARKKDPKGMYCGFCGKENDFADDCGWMYVYDLREGLQREGFAIKNKNLPCCEACYRGEPGTKHVEHFGLAER